MTDDDFEALVDQIDTPTHVKVLEAMIAHARECREALRLVQEEEHPHEPHCTPYAGANQHLTHGPCTCHVAAARRCLEGT